MIGMGWRRRIVLAADVDDGKRTQAAFVAAAIVMAAIGSASPAYAWLTGRALLFDRGQQHDGRVGVQEALEGGMSEPAVEIAIVDHSDKAWLDPPHPCR